MCAGTAIARYCAFSNRPLPQVFCGTSNTKQIKPEPVSDRTKSGGGEKGAERSVELSLIRTPEVAPEAPEVPQNTVNTPGVLEGSPAFWS